MRQWPPDRVHGRGGRGAPRAVRPLGPLHGRQRLLRRRLGRSERAPRRRRRDRRGGRAVPRRRCRLPRRVRAGLHSGFVHRHRLPRPHCPGRRSEDRARRLRAAGLRRAATRRHGDQTGAGLLRGLREREPAQRDVALQLQPGDDHAARRDAAQRPVTRAVVHPRRHRLPAAAPAGVQGGRADRPRRRGPAAHRAGHAPRRPGHAASARAPAGRDGSRQDPAWPGNRIRLLIMRQFSSSGFRLWNLGIEAKVLYTTFCLLTLLGIVSSALYYGDLVGAGTSGIKSYYAGEARVAPPTAPPPGTAPGGPAIDVPEDEQSRRPIVVPMTYRKLLEVTHFHLFTMPVVLLIVGHLFLATGLRDRAKFVWLVAAAASVAAHLATPWIVRYGGGGLAFLHAITGIALTLTMGMLTVYPVVAMWRGKSQTAQETRP